MGATRLVKGVRLVQPLSGQRAQRPLARLAPVTRQRVALFEPGSPQAEAFERGFTFGYGLSTPSGGYGLAPTLGRAAGQVATGQPVGDVFASLTVETLALLIGLGIVLISVAQLIAPAAEKAAPLVATAVGGPAAGAATKTAVSGLEATKQMGAIRKRARQSVRAAKSRAV